MALIKCKDCGHDVSDKASACPNCGCPIEKVPVCGECGQQIPDGVEACPNCGCPTKRIKTVNQEEVEKHKKKNGWIWALAIMLLCLIGGGGYYFYNQSKGDSAEAEKDTSQNDNNSVIADGDYCYKGEWRSSRYAAQPCKVVFTKKDTSLVNCSYTNLKYNSLIPLKGTIHGNELHFVGEINGKQLVIDLKVSSDGNSVIGEGVDNAHSDKAKLNLTKSMVDNTTYSEEGRADSVNSNTDEGEYVAGVLKKGNWAYSNSTDPMTDKVFNAALCMSNESQDICGQRTNLQLYIMHMPSGNNSVFVQIEDGVLRQDKLPMIYFRFDGGKVDTFAVLANGANTHLIPNEKKAKDIINRLKKTKKCAIKVEAQDGGTATYTFNTEGLEWNY